MKKRKLAAKAVAQNWRIRTRLSRITKLAWKLGYINVFTEIKRLEE